ncbi:UNVERIFIED_ORG: DNA primase [Dietzia maris]|uniref:DNA primase n=1 Tax=Dietzia maris TaxID=37915 RepID=UPI0010DF22A1
MTASTGRPRLARLPDEFLEELRSRVSIVEIATEYTDLKPAGAARYKGLCPFHQENTPSFTVQTDSGRYHCFGCGADGDAISLLTESGGLTFREAVEDLSDRYGLRVPQVDTGTELDPSVPLRAALNECQTHLVRWLTEHPQAGPAREFLRDRGFSAEHAALWELGFHPGGNQTLARTVNASIDTLLHAGMLADGKYGQYEVFHDRLMWPLRDAQGRMVGYAGRDLDGSSRAKYINTRETALYRKQDVLFGLHLARRDMLRNRQVYLVEGYTDVMAMVDAGLSTTVATCGTAFTAHHASLISARIGDGGEVVTGFDNDAAGHEAAWATFLAVQQFTTNVTSLDLAGTDVKGDPCDVRARSGASALADLAHRRTPLLRTILRNDINAHDLAAPEGKTAARDAVARRLDQVHDPILRREYVPLAAQWIGIETADFPSTARTSARTAARPAPVEAQPPAQEVQRARFSESALAVTATLMYRPDLIDDASWYGDGDLAGVLGEELAEVAQMSSALYPQGRPTPGTEDSVVWTQAMFEVLDPPLHPAVSASSMTDPANPEEYSSLILRVARSQCRRRLAAIQSEMDTVDPSGLPALMGRYQALNAHMKELKAL